ncbi:MAG TPA: hypothetical protein PKA14_26040 [Leptospiraceae bacterium]|nr:hypothetical protein [Leptospiraceae bacterium]
MTALLEQAIDRIRELSESEQDILAAFIFERLKDNWDAMIEKDFAPDGRLHWMLEEAKIEFESGITVEGGFDCR